MKRRVCSYQERIFNFLDSFYGVYTRRARERPTQLDMAIEWGLSEDSSLRKKVREASVPGLKLTHRRLIEYCRLRKWQEDHPSSDIRELDHQTIISEFGLPSIRATVDLMVFGIGIERLCLGLPLETPESAVQRFKRRCRVYRVYQLAKAL